MALKRNNILLILATITSLFVLTVVPAAAEGGASGAGSGDSSSGGTIDAESGGDTPSSGTTSTSTTETEVHQQGEQLLTQKRKHGEIHSLQDRQKACTQRQAGVDKKEANFTAAAERHLGVFDGLLTKVQDFKTTKNLTVTNYDSLVTAAQVAQTTAKNAVDALKALDVKVDCAQPDPAQTIATLKTAVSDARSALQAYQAAIKNLLVAVKSAAGSGSQSTGGQQ